MGNNTPMVQEIFDKYGIKDGRHIKISHLIQMRSDFYKLDRETKKEILQMMPGFQAKLLEGLGKVEEFSSKVIASNDESERQVYGMQAEAINAINEELKNPDISDERRKELTAERQAILAAAASKDSEGKNFKIRIVNTVAGCFIFIGTTAICLLTNGKVEIPRA